MNQILNLKARENRSNFIQFIKYLKKHSYKRNPKSYFQNIKNEIFIVSADFYHYTIGYAALMNALRYDDTRMLLAIETNCRIDENNTKGKEWFDEVRSEISKVNMEVFIGPFDNVVVTTKCDYKCKSFEKVFEKLIKVIEYIHQSKSNFLYDLDM